MTTITREQLIKKAQEQIAFCRDTKVTGEGRAHVDQCAALFEIALAAMDSEPVVCTDERNLGYIDRGRETAYLWGKQNSEASDVALYRHAQQPVVPPMQHWEELCREYPDMSIGDAIIRAAWWNHCRAAMLQAGNSPAHSGSRPEKISGYPAQDGNSPAQSPIDHGYRPECECSGCKATARICAELAGWIPVSERMPENDVSVLTYDGMYKRVHHAMYGHWQCWGPEKITHWMPLPAAPQEVNHG
ncbi:DUF551 domain-containing protein [Raoultella planticola]|uniref:DUF551 domain-containing protein n=1 Tax=Raoultella planticola TaxID=575 RepID=UPI001D18983E|nr:DUF551 domain-containing protein [Raoultella planticola]